MSPQILEQQNIGKKVAEFSDSGTFDKAIAILELNSNEKVNLNVFGKDMLTPLMNAAINGSEAAFNKYLERGADIDLQDQLGNTAVIYAMEFGRHLIVKTALDNGANPDIQNKKGITLFMIAARNNDLDGASIIIKHSTANPFLRNQDGITAAQIAVNSKLTDMERLFTDYEKSYTERKTYSKTLILNSHSLKRR